MTDDSVVRPQELLSAVHDLTRKVRAAQRGTWFPLLVLAAITLLAIPFYRYLQRPLGTCQAIAPDRTACAGVPSAILWYWPATLVLAYALIAVFYVRRSRRRGVGTSVRPYVLAGIGIAVLATIPAIWRVAHATVPRPGAPLPEPNLLAGLAAPTVALGLALLALAWAERSWALLAYSVVYVGVVLAQGSRPIHVSSPWGFLPLLLVPAALLLVGSAGFALAQRAAR